MNVRYFLGILFFVASTYPQSVLAQSFPLDEIVPRFMADVQVGRDTSEFFKLLEQTDAYLTSRDKTNQLLLDRVLTLLKAFYTQRVGHLNDQKYQDPQLQKVAEAFEDLFIFILKKGSENQQFTQLVRDRWQSLSAQETTTNNSLKALMRRVYPQFDPDFGKQKAQPAPRVSAPKKRSDAFLEIEPRREVFLDAAKFIDVCERLRSSTFNKFDWLLSCLPEDLTYAYPGTNDSLPIVLAKHMLKKRDFYQEEKVSVEQFQAVLHKGKNDPQFRWQLNRLLEFVTSYPDEARIVIDAIDTSPDFTDRCGRFRQGVLFPQPQVNEQREAEKMSACFRALIFKLVGIRGPRFFNVLQKHPLLVHALDETGLSLIHVVVQKYLYAVSQINQSPTSKYYQNEKKKFEDCFAQLVIAGAPVDKTYDKYDRMYEYTNTPGRYVYKKSDIPHPSIRDILEGKKSFTINYTDVSTQVEFTQARADLRALMQLDRVALIKKYPFLKRYEPKAQEGVQQAHAPGATAFTKQEEKEEKQPTFFDAWKGTFRFLGAGILVGSVLYYGVKRSMSTPEELYKNSVAKTA